MIDEVSRPQDQRQLSGGVGTIARHLLRRRLDVIKGRGLDQVALDRPIEQLASDAQRAGWR